MCEVTKYNSPTQTLQLHYTCDLESKLRSLTAQNVTSENVLSETSLTSGCGSYSIDVLLRMFFCKQTFAYAKVIYYVKTNKDFLEY